ncbi:MAG: hypothetical protein ACTSQB_00265 [Candidatus Heimdallarchaeota archaeon]
MSIEVGGKIYIQVTEEEYDSCKGCVANCSTILCNDLTAACDGSCENRIFKLEEKQMKTITHIIRAQAVNLLERQLKHEVRREFVVEKFDSIVEGALKDLDGIALEFLETCFEDISTEFKENFIRNRIFDDVNDFIMHIKHDTISDYSGIDAVKQEAVTILECDLLDSVADDEANEIANIALASFYEDISERYSDSLVDLVKRAVDNVDSADEYARDYADDEVDVFIAEI